MKTLLLFALLSTPVLAQDAPLVNPDDGGSAGGTGVTDGSCWSGGGYHFAMGVTALTTGSFRVEGEETDEGWEGETDNTVAHPGGGVEKSAPFMIIGDNGPQGGYVNARVRRGKMQYQDRSTQRWRTMRRCKKPHPDDENARAGGNTVGTLPSPEDPPLPWWWRLWLRGAYG
jgi:hypothetical protein